MKKLYKSTIDKKLSGVIGGFAEYLNIDSTVLRVLFVFGVLVTGGFPLVIGYIIAALMMPEKVDHFTTPSPHHSTTSEPHRE